MSKKISDKTLKMAAAKVAEHKQTYGPSSCSVCGEVTPLPGAHKCNPTYKELQSQLAEATSTITCMFCGHEMKRGKVTGTAAVLLEHLLECKDHPLARRIDELVKELATEKDENKRLREGLARPTKCATNGCDTLIYRQHYCPRCQELWES